MPSIRQEGGSIASSFKRHPRFERLVIPERRVFGTLSPPSSWMVKLEYHTHNTFRLMSMIGCESRLVLPAAATRAPPAAGVAAAGVELAVFLRDLVLELNMLGSSNARVHRTAFVRSAE